jgi:ribosome modulation factor
MAKPKASAAQPEPEQQAPDNTGHNSGELTPAEAKALKYHHFHAISAQKEKVETEQAEYKRLRKLAKADTIVLSDIDFMMKCAEIDDPSILTDRAKREVEIMQWFALPVQFQPDLFGQDNREPAVDRAGREGEAAGFAAKAAEPPYDVSSEQGQAWMAGWHKAQEQARADLLSAMTKRNSVKDELIKAAENGDDPFADADEREAAE